MRKFRTLTVWRKAMSVVDLCYDSTEGLPSQERYVLVPQMRRAAISVTSNTAEGSGRGTDREFAQYLRVAAGSACELETQATIAASRYPSVAPPMHQLVAASEEVRRMLAALILRTMEDDRAANAY